MCVCVCVSQLDEWLSAAVATGEPLCTVLSNHHNLHLAGKWYDDKCSETSYGFDCQKAQGEPSVCHLKPGDT